VLLFADESEALTHPYLARAWAKRGADLRVQAPGQARKVAMMGALDWRDRRLIVATSRTKRSADFIAFLEELDHHHGPKPGQCQSPVVIVLDNGPIHTSKATQAALAARAHWLSVEWLPKYAPEHHRKRMRTSNPMERAVQQELKRRTVKVRVFPSEDALERLASAILAEIDEKWASDTKAYIKWECQDA
jgi:hypothetical protein